jgi:hypothetical protein
MAELIIDAAHVELDDGSVAATVARVATGGGTQVVTVDGQPEERVHPGGVVYHVRLISADRMVPDQLQETTDLEIAGQIAVRYAGKLATARQAAAEALK